MPSQWNTLSPSSEDFPSEDSLLPSVLVHLTRPDGRVLNGWFVGGTCPIAVLHIHGAMGNFYANTFIVDEARALHRQGIAFLSLNSASHDVIAEVVFADGAFTYGGGAIDPFEECFADIATGVEWLRQRFEGVVLQGHSLGCERIIAAELQHSYGSPLVLLCPGDSLALQRNWVGGTSALAEQVARLERSHLTDDPVALGQEIVLTLDEYGVKAGACEYAIPIVKRCLLAWLRSPWFGLFSLADPPKWLIHTPVLTVHAGQDELSLCSADEWERWLKLALPKSTSIRAEGSDHSLATAGSMVWNLVASWVRTSTL